MDFNPAAGEIYSMFLNAFPSDNLVDLTQTGGDGHPKGFYMDNDGTCMTQGIGSSRDTYCELSPEQRSLPGLVD